MTISKEKIIQGNISIKGDFEKVDTATRDAFFLIFGFTASSFDLFAASIWANMPEASQGSALSCIGWKYEDWKFTFLDTEGDNPKKHLSTTKGICLAAVAVFMVMKAQGQFKGIPISDLKDECEYDAIAVDAIAQLAILGEVIYG